ncbi:putative membrane protein [Halanaeroarchaeum sp. HSR-CO]|uniref:PEGA domain-containing protein n=1 Tax=Halanaeroarchaeum sp. HSR-CO TaxID=2866382 RepID=UPI00217EB90F|nr:PEGA domain-containing protein [Halanaeroarchaeum sp. HSR-CO]UWG46967.1 putative membrane protein [Halanaeroarchaeum sp. HSR-CO]
MRYIGVFLSLLVATSVVAMGGAGVASAQSTVTLTVSVTTADGAAVDGADLTATWDDGSTTATTASNGKAFVDVPDGADVTIEVAHEDYVRNSPYEVTDASEREVDVTVAAKANATIAVEDDDGPVEAARVVLEMDGETVLDAETAGGDVETDTIEAGTYDLTVSKNGYYTTETELAITNDTTTTVTIERGTVPLTVNVTDDYFEPPRGVSGATVEVEGAGSVITQSDGTQQISVPVNSQPAVTVSKDGYVTVERTITVRESERTIHFDVDREFALSVERSNQQIVVGETVRVTVTDEYGDPVADAVVRLDDSVVARTNDEGEATISIDEAGEQEFTVSKGDAISASTTVTGVSPGDETTEQTETTATTEPTTTDSSTTEVGGLPDIPGEYIPLAIVGVALIAVLFGVRWWQQR